MPAPIINEEVVTPEAALPNQTKKTTANNDESNGVSKLLLLKFGLVAALLIAIGLAVGLGVGLSENDDDDSSDDFECPSVDPPVVNETDMCLNVLQASSVPIPLVQECGSLVSNYIKEVKSEAPDTNGTVLVTIDQCGLAMEQAQADDGPAIEQSLPRCDAISYGRDLVTLIVNPGDGYWASERNFRLGRKNHDTGEWQRCKTISVEGGGQYCDCKERTCKNDLHKGWDPHCSSYTTWTTNRNHVYFFCQGNLAPIPSGCDPVKLKVKYDCPAGNFNGYYLKHESTKESGSVKLDCNDYCPETNEFNGVVAWGGTSSVPPTDYLAKLHDLFAYSYDGTKVTIKTFDTDGGWVEDSVRCCCPNP